MSKRYRVSVHDTASEYTEVTADSPEDASMMAEPPSCCHQCPELSRAPWTVVYDAGTGEEVYNDDWTEAIKRERDVARARVVELEAELAELRGGAS